MNGLGKTEKHVNDTLFVVPFVTIFRCLLPFNELLNLIRWIYFLRPHPG